MKLSELDDLLRAAERCFVAHGWALPPNWRWDVSYFGLGAWREFGLVMVNLAEEPEYCEKLMYAQGGMRTPARCRRSRKKDIICRWGRLAVRVWSGRPDEQHRESISVPVNHEPAAIPSGAVIEDAGSRILLTGIYYEIHRLSQECILGEVSTANDDAQGNYFVNPNIGRYPGIEEDELAIVRLVSEE